MPSIKQRAFAYGRSQEEQTLADMGLASMRMAAEALNLTISEIDQLLRRPDAPPTVPIPSGFSQKVGANERKFWIMADLEHYINRSRPLDYQAAKTLLQVLSRSAHKQSFLTSAKRLRDV